QRAVLVDEVGAVASRNRRRQQSRAQHAHLLVRARNRPLRSETAHDREPPEIALVEEAGPDGNRAGRQGDVECLTDFEAGESRGRHADDRNRLLGNGQRAANGRVAAAEVRLPESVTDYGRARAASAPIVVSRQDTSALGNDTKRGEEIAADPEA